MQKTCLMGAAFALIASVVVACTPVHETKRHNSESLRPLSSESSQSLTIAFIGDQGSGSDARAVLQLIKDEGADLILHQGDLDYRDDPASWNALITSVLGVKFPYFATVGNHDATRWYGPSGYQAKLQARLNEISSARCSGDLGVKSACSYRGLFFIQSGAGTIPDISDDPGHIAFIQDQLAKTDAAWRICSWHKNQSLMQVGLKGDEVGWGAYEACRRGGAIIATGHEHSYARTHLMDSFEPLSVASTSGTLRIEKGRTFSFVSGLGGISIRDQDQDGPWWAAVYSSDQGANFGALFCTFFVNSKPNWASCYFKDIDGKIPDRFELFSNVASPR